VTGVSLLEIGASHVNVFVGSGGPYFQDSNGDGVIDSNDTPASAGATGVAFSNVGFGLALMKAPDGSSFYALEASGSGTLVGVQGVQLDAQNMMIQANGGSIPDGSLPPIPAAVNFGLTATNFPGEEFGASGLSVPTGPGTSIDVGGAAFNNRFLSASGS